MLRRLVLGLALAAAGCATHYQPRAWSGGYSETRPAPDVFEVTFDANGYTSSETARAYLLYRCAELTREQGFDHFVVVRSEDLTSLSISANLSVVTKPSYSARIRVGRGPKPEGEGSFAAADVLRDLGPRIQR